MTHPSTGRRTPDMPTLVSGTTVVLGVGLWMTVGKEWIALAALGAFVPGILREFGLLRSRDEFQTAASRRAGYRAYLVGGLFTAAIVTVLHLTGDDPPYPADLITIVLVVLGLTWSFDYIMSYWGARKTASRLLIAFGAFWGLFAILSAFSEGDGPLDVALGLLMGGIVVAPFFMGAWAIRRHPRLTGWLLVGAACLGMWLVGPRSNTLPWSTQLFTMIVLVLPLLLAGLGLIGGPLEDPDIEE